MDAGQLQLQKYYEQLDQRASLGAETKPCATVIKLLPLRYAVLGMPPDAQDRAGLPLLPAQANPAMQGRPQLQGASYVLRPLRAGYIYLFLKQSGQWWAYAHQIREDGCMRPYDPAKPPPEDALQHVHEHLELQQGRTVDKGGIGETMQFEFPDRVEEMRALYTPDPLTPRMQERYRTEDALRATLQWFNLKQLAYQYMPLPDTLAPEDIDECVVDYRLRKDRTLTPASEPDSQHSPFRWALEKRLKKQLYPLDERILTNVGQVQAAIVLHDPIGITQELNAWRNEAVETVKDWLDYVDSDGVTNERRVLTARTFLELQKDFTERRTAALMDRGSRYAREQLDEADGALPPGMSEAQWKASKEAILRSHDNILRADLEHRAKAGEFAEAFKRYEKLVHVPMMPVALQQFDDVSARAAEEAKTRVPDHQAWLEHERLLCAFDVYDDEHAGSGWSFANQAGLCTLGMEGTEEGAKLLSQWWKADKADRPNLVLRGIALNQEEVTKELERTIAKLKQPDQVADAVDGVESGMKHATTLAGMYGVLDGYLESQSSHGMQPAGALALVGHLGREVLRTAAPNTHDRILNRCLSVVLMAQLGPRAVSMRMAEHAAAGRVVSPGRVAAPILRTLDRVFTTQVTNARSNTFYKVRANSAVLFFQAGLLLLQGRSLDEQGGGRFLADLTAGALTTAAAGFELLAVGVEHSIAETSSASVVNRNSMINLGRFRLWGAGLASVAGLISIKVDLGDAFDADANANIQLRNAYFARFTATGALALVQGLATLATAGPLFNWLAETSATPLGRSAALSLARASSVMASEVAVLWLGRLNLWLTVGIVIVSVTISVIEGDDLEQWCNQCCYRTAKAGKTFRTTESELGELFGAIKAVI